MAESGVSRLSRSREQHGTVGAAPHEKSAAHCARGPGRDVHSEPFNRYPAVCQRPPDPDSNASTLQTKLRALKGHWPVNRAAQLSEGTASDGGPPGDGRGGRWLEGELGSGFQRRTYLTDRILSREEGQFAGGKCLPRRQEEPVSSETPPWPNGQNPPEKCNAKDWSPPKEFWKVLDGQNLASGDRADTCDDGLLQKESWNINGSARPTADYSNGSGPRGPSGERASTNSLGSSALRCGEWPAGKCTARKLGHLGGLWRTDSWESISSNASLLSLTEKVELNRSNIKRMLAPALLQPGPGLSVESLSQENLAPSGCRLQSSLLDDLLPGNKCTKQGCGMVQSDSDWDSGISLQESDRGIRAFVSSSQLPLSPRHEQAKRLLERARMKARASPLKADHSILPVERSPLETSGDGTTSLKKGPFFRDGLYSNTHHSGNLSDSSSGESRCGPRKKRSQSPSQVRFEDESTQEAEVRHQLRRKCGLEPSLCRGLRGLIPKPGLPVYGFPSKECALKADSGDTSKPCCNNRNALGTWGWRSGANPITNGEAEERPHDQARGPHINTAICIDGKCSCCGSYIILDSKASRLDPPSYEFPDDSIVPQGREPYTPNRQEHPLDTAMGVKTNLTAEAPDVVSLPPRVIPCWVLPSQHRFRVEPIKETYIGEVTSIDDVSLADTGAPFQDSTVEMNDSRGAKVSAYCYAIVSGSNARTAGSIELNAKGKDQPRTCTGDSRVITEPVNSATDWKSKARRKTIDRGRDCVQPTQCQRERGPAGSSPKCRRSANSKLVGSAPVSKHSHIASLSTGRLTQVTPVSEQRHTPLNPAPTSGQSSEQNRESAILQSPSSPQYRLIHLDPQRSDERLSDSQAVLEASSLQSQRSAGVPDLQLPDGHVHALHSSGPPAHSPICPAVRLPRNTVTSGASQSSESSRAPNQFIDPNGEALPSEHHESNELAKNPNCLTGPSPETVSSSEQDTEKQNDKMERRPAMVKTRPRDTTSGRKQPAPVMSPEPGEQCGPARPPEPGIGPDHCGERPTHRPADGPSGGHRVPASSAAQQMTGRHLKSRSSLKAFFATIGHSTVSKLSRLRSSSLEQINRRSTEDTPGERQYEETQGPLRKAPSLQSLRLVSPLAQLRKASSIQSLHSQKKKSRCSSYLVAETTEAGLGGSDPKPSGRRPTRSLSVEDIGSPNHPRVIGQVTQTFADASFMLELTRPAHGPFGFFISRSCGGIFIHQMADRNAEKLYSGLLELGDEILEVNGELVEGLSFNEVNSLMVQDSKVSIRVKRHNGTARQQEHEQ
uniref:uncharacterized protein KIAA1614 homolog n=1 Tax=Pristiophorus japonicus TaxID=55135 RepID=UPI00398F593B